MPKPGMTKAPMAGNSGITTAGKSSFPATVNAGTKTAYLAIQGFAVPARNVLPGISGAVKVVSAVPGAVQDGNRPTEVNALVGAKNMAQGATKTVSATGRVVVSGAGLVARKIATKNGATKATRVLKKAKLVRKGVGKTVGTVSNVAGRTARIAQTMTQHDGAPEEATAKTFKQAGVEAGSWAVDKGRDVAVYGVKRAGEKVINDRLAKKTQTETVEVVNKASQKSIEKASKIGSKVGVKGRRIAKEGSKVASQGAKLATGATKAVKVVSKTTAVSTKTATATAKVAGVAVKTAGAVGTGATATVATGGVGAPVVIAAGVAYTMRHFAIASTKAAAKATRKALETFSKAFDDLFNMVDKAKTYLIGATLVGALFLAGMGITIVGGATSAISDAAAGGIAAILSLETSVVDTFKGATGFFSEIAIDAEEWVKNLHNGVPQYGSGQGYKLAEKAGFPAKSFGKTGNCTWYAYGRVYELTGVQCKFTVSSGRNGGNWWKYLVGNHTQTPLPGAVICFKATDSHPYGHVAVVESVDPDGTIHYSDDGSSYHVHPHYGTLKRGAGGKYTYSGMTVQGFVIAT